VTTQITAAEETTVFLDGTRDGKFSWEETFVFEIDFSYD